MRIVFDACNNILAAEYLFRKNDREEYQRRITQLSEIQLNDELMYELHFRMSFNRDYMNLAFMLNQGYFDKQLKILTDFLDASEGMDTLDNHGVMTIEEYLEKKGKGVIDDDNN